MKRRLSATSRLWAKRAGIAALAGIAAGISGGLLGLRILSGGAPAPAPAPALPVEDAPAAPRRTYSGPRADGMRRGAATDSLSGSGQMASLDSVGLVPDIVGRAEGDARKLLERAGFTVGNILFREADERIGTVLQSFPVPGERVQLPATVNLILADRRRTIDPTFPDTGMFIPDSIALPDSMEIMVRGDSLRGDSLSGDSLSGDSIRGSSFSDDSLRHYFEMLP